MALSLLDTGQTAIVSGFVDASAATQTDAATTGLTTTDGAVKVKVTSATDGQFTVVFGHDFLSAPRVFLQVHDDTVAATLNHAVVVTSVTASQFTMEGWNYDGTAAADDIDFEFLCIGARNR